LIGIHLVKPVSGLASSMLGDIVGQGCRVQAASTEAKTLAKRLSGLEEFVRY
jgi:hypothetical protein